MISITLSKVKIKGFFVLLFCSISNSLLAQEPHHFFLGSEELSGFDIYGINQDQAGVYWITSDKGLTSYDGYIFKQYENEKQLNSSLFNPTLNYKGELFCNNLSGQIFKVDGDSLTLFHTIPDSLLEAYTNFNFLPNNELIVSSGQCYRVHDDRLEVLREDMSEHGQGSLFRQKDGSLLVNNTYTSLVKITENGFTEVKIDIDSADRRLFQFHNHNQSLLGFDRRGEVFLIDTIDDQTLSAVQIWEKNDFPSRIYPTSENIWMALDRFGVSRRPYSKEKAAISNTSSVLFENYFISYVFEDNDGNVLLGTFDNGIIVIPQTEMENIEVPNGVNISIITSDNDRGVFYGTVQGHIYHWENGITKVVKDKGARAVENLNFYQNGNHLFYDDRSLFSYQNGIHRRVDNSIVAIKDIVQIGEGEFAVGNFVATTLVKNTAEGFKSTTVFKTGRVNHLAYNKAIKTLYVNTNKGMLKVDSLGDISPLFEGEKEILISDMKQSDSVTYVATRKHGVLKMMNERVYTFLDTSSRLLDDDVRQIDVRKNRIYIATEGGFQIFNTDGTLVKTISSADGLGANKINDFAVDDYFIWFLGRNGLQRYNLESVENEHVKIPSIRHIDIYKNDKKIVDDTNTFSNDTYSIMFRVFAPTITLQDDVKYLYRLNDDGVWNENDYPENEIKFSALAPAKYTLQVKLMHKGEEVDARSIPFAISPPFYQTSWFYLLSIVLVIVTFILSLRFRLKKQELRNQEILELNTSKLTALQSQMNPHFIFNALNSIQEYILHNDRRLAGKYLGKFADLIRMYLDHSRKKFISLQEEIDTLDLYLQLEKLRFENTLTFTIEVDKNANLDVKVPAMFIQPYVENALKHGLLHRIDDRRLTISISKPVDNKHIICIIEDNGIGRVKSREINELRRHNHQPFATSANARRLELINTHRKYPIIQETEDLYDEFDQAIGTKVKIVIPLDEN